MGSASTELHLRWTSYETTLLTSVYDLWGVGALTDVSLSADGRIIRAHKVVLSSCSGYFNEVLRDVTQAQHPIIVLPFACHRDLLAVIQFMYRGEVNITQSELPGLLACAELLQVKGLAKINPHRASGLLQQAYQQDSTNSSSKQNCPHIKVEPDIWNTSSSLSYGEDEEAVEITEISEDGEDNTLVVDEDGEASQDSGDDNDSTMSGGDQNEGKLYYLTSLGQHEDGAEDDVGNEGRVMKSTATKKKNRRRLYRALTAAWNAAGTVKDESSANTSQNGQRSAIRKTLLPVSCPVCFKVLSNAYNLKVHMSIHDGLNHQCSVCGHTSKSRDALRKHLAYRHLIGMSGPVRPRMPANKRTKRSNGDVDDRQLSNSEEPPDGAEGAPPFQDGELLQHSGGEEVGDANHHHSDPPLADEPW